MRRAGGSREISPRRTRSGLLICNEEVEEGEGRSEEPAVSSNLGQRLRVSVLRCPVTGRGHGTGGTEHRGVEVVGRPLPDQRQGVATSILLPIAYHTEDEVIVPEVIDLSDEEENSEEASLDVVDIWPVSPIGAAFLEMQNQRGLEADPVHVLPDDQPVTPQSRSMLNSTIDLTVSPLVPPSLNFSTSSTSTAPPPSPFPSSIQCLVCMESTTTIRRQGYHLLSTVCGHIFCSHCLPECLRLNSQCPTCRQRLSSRDFHQLFLQ